MSYTLSEFSVGKCLMGFLHGIMTFSCAENVYSTLPFTERGQSMVINGDPKGKNMLYCNGNTVVIRDIEVSLHS